MADIAHQLAGATDAIRCEIQWLKDQSARITSELDRVEPIVRKGWQRMRDLEAELKRVTDHLDTLANDHADERTADIDAAIFCARELLNI